MKMCAAIILVCGYRRTGKDQLYDILARQSMPERFKWRVYKHPSCINETFDLSRTHVRIAFADVLKREASEQYKIPAVVSDAEKDIKQFNHYQTGEMVSARDIYIEWGSIRRAQDPNYWCKVALNPIRDLQDITAVITDWRFRNEARYTLNTFKRVTTVRVYRSDVPEPPADIESEHDLDAYKTDFLLIRDDKPDEFAKAVEHFPQYREHVACETL